MGKIISFDFNDAKPQRNENENKIPPDIAFREFIQECGFNRPESIIEDGEIHRYGKNKVDWYLYHPHQSNPAGAFGCWKSMEKNVTWCYRGAEMSAREREDHEIRMAQIRRKVSDDRERMHAQAREEVAKVWAEAKEPENHPYLKKKGVRAHGIRMHKGELLIPYRDQNGLLHSIQKITASGELQRIDGSKPELSDADSDRKRKAEADSAEYDARIKRIKAEAIEARYVDREIFEDELSVQALQFRNSIVTFINSMAEEIVSYVGGDTSRIPDLIEFMLTRADEHFVKCAEQMELTGPLVDIDKIDTSDTDDDIEDRDAESYDSEGARC